MAEVERTGRARKHSVMRSKTPRKVETEVPGDNPTRRHLGTESSIEKGQKNGRSIGAQRKR